MNPRGPRGLTLMRMVRAGPDSNLALIMRNSCFRLRSFLARTLERVAAETSPAFSVSAVSTALPASSQSVHGPM